MSALLSTAFEWLVAQTRSRRVWLLSTVLALLALRKLRRLARLQHEALVDDRSFSVLPFVHLFFLSVGMLLFEIAIDIAAF